jgi:hypothetical protein
VSKSRFHGHARCNCRCRRHIEPSRHLAWRQHWSASLRKVEAPNDRSYLCSSRRRRMARRPQCAARRSPNLAASTLTASSAMYQDCNWMRRSAGPTSPPSQSRLSGRPNVGVAEPRCAKGVASVVLFGHDTNLDLSGPCAHLLESGYVNATVNQSAASHRPTKREPRQEPQDFSDAITIAGNHERERCAARERRRAAPLQPCADRVQRRSNSRQGACLGWGSGAWSVESVASSRMMAVSPRWLIRLGAQRRGCRAGRSATRTLPRSSRLIR